MKAALFYKIWLIFFVLMQTKIYAQSQGVDFIKTKDWKEVIQKAKSENKMILVDCYTTWCHPCRLMASEVFSKPEVGDYINTHFIAVKIQMDSTKNDSEAIRSWYADAREMIYLYQIRSYPTFLYFDSGGNLVHRSVGAVPAQEFLRIASNALDSDSQYYSLLKKLEDQNVPKEFYVRAFHAARDASETQRADSIFRVFWSCSNDSERNSIGVLSESVRFVETTADPVFPYLLTYLEKQGTPKSEEFREIEWKVKRLIAQEIAGFLDGMRGDFERVDSVITANYPRYSLELLAKGQMDYYLKNKQFSQFLEIIETYRKDKRYAIEREDLLNYAYQIFYYAKDVSILHSAESWMKELNTEEDISVAIILGLINYKLGKQKDAILFIKSAIEQNPQADNIELTEMLTRIEEGAILWYESEISLPE